MRCNWEQYLQVLPAWMRPEVDKLGKQQLMELRLRLGQLPMLVLPGDARHLQKAVTQQDLSYVVSTASRYSPWTSASMASGFITAPGGHRIGICGEAAVHNGNVTGFRSIHSLCMRVARDFDGLIREPSCLEGSVLIIGRPGSGKTTLLRDLIRYRAANGKGSVGVVDERGELFPRSGDSISGYGNFDVLLWCGKQQGISMLLRTMGNACIAVDEISDSADCDALLQAGWCGVSLLATAHAANMMDLRTRPVYKPLIEHGLFDKILIMQPDKSWRLERN